MMLQALCVNSIRFRQHNIVIVTEIEKTFLKVGFQIEQRDVAIFLWLKYANPTVPTENIQEFVSFGVISNTFSLKATTRHPQLIQASYLGKVER